MGQSDMLFKLSHLLLDEPLAIIYFSQTMTCYVYFPKISSVILIVNIISFLQRMKCLIEYLNGSTINDSAEIVVCVWIHITADTVMSTATVPGNGWVCPDKRFQKMWPNKDHSHSIMLVLHGHILTLVIPCFFLLLLNSKRTRCCFFLSHAMKH